MTLELELPDSKEAALRAKAQAKGVSPEQFAEQVINRELEEPTSSSAAPRRHISETIRERMRNVPAKVWTTLPTDGASEHDHYIYGLPRRHS